MQTMIQDSAVEHIDLGTHTITCSTVFSKGPSERLRRCEIVSRHLAERWTPEMSNRWDKLREMLMHTPMKKRIHSEQQYAVEAVVEFLNFVGLLGIRADVENVLANHWHNKINVMGYVQDIPVSYKFVRDTAKELVLNDYPTVASITYFWAENLVVTELAGDNLSKLLQPLFQQKRLEEIETLIQKAYDLLETFYKETQPLRLTHGHPHFGNICQAISTPDSTDVDLILIDFDEITMHTDEQSYDTYVVGDWRTFFGALVATCNIGWDPRHPVIRHLAPEDTFDLVRRLYTRLENDFYRADLPSQARPLLDNVIQFLRDDTFWKARDSLVYWEHFNTSLDQFEDAFIRDTRFDEKGPDDETIEAMRRASPCVNQFRTQDIKSRMEKWYIERYLFH